MQKITFSANYLREYVKNSIILKILIWLKIIIFLFYLLQNNKKITIDKSWAHKNTMSLFGSVSKNNVRENCFMIFSRKKYI